MKYSVRHITKGGESFFAIIGDGNEIVSELRDCANWTEARKAFRDYVAARG